MPHRSKLHVQAPTWVAYARIMTLLMSSPAVFLRAAIQRIKLVSRHYVGVDLVR